MTLLWGKWGEGAIWGLKKLGLFKSKTKAFLILCMVKCRYGNFFGKEGFFNFQQYFPFASGSASEKCSGSKCCCRRACSECSVKQVKCCCRHVTPALPQTLESSAKAWKSESMEVMPRVCLRQKVITVSTLSNSDLRHEE